MKTYISSDPEIFGGAPVVKGTRIPIERIIFLIKDGFTLNGIHKQYPHIALDTLQGVIGELLNQVTQKTHASLS